MGGMAWATKKRLDKIKNRDTIYIDRQIGWLQKKETAMIPYLKIAEVLTVKGVTLAKLKTLDGRMDMIEVLCKAFPSSWMDYSQNHVLARALNGNVAKIKEKSVVDGLF